MFRSKQSLRSKECDEASEPVVTLQEVMGMTIPRVVRDRVLRVTVLKKDDGAGPRSGGLKVRQDAC